MRIGQDQVTSPRRLSVHALLTPCCRSPSSALHDRWSPPLPWRSKCGVYFGAMEGTEEEDDAISVAVSAREEWSNSQLDYTAPHGSDAGDLHHSDVELLSVLSKAVDELGFEWAPPAEPARSRLYEWFLQSDRGRKDAPRRPGPFFPEMHDEIKNSWNMPLTSRVHNSGSSLLSSVDRADK